ncbi:MAG TPA: xylulokinase [Gemmatimonadaceae bacterium]|nr:xylulokinase [Gemmatimonadaceae bacterium]
MSASIANRAGAVFLGVDVGTSGVKAVATSERGDVLAAATAPLTLQTPRPGWAEQDPEAWWAASRDAVRDLTSRLGERASRVAAIGLSGQMHSSVFLDASGDVVRPALLWCDARTGAECEEITEAVGGEDRLRDWTCNAALAGFTLPKVLWLRRHEPAAFARTTTVLLAKDYVRYRLSGALATEPSDASGTLMYDTRRDHWSREMLDAVGLSESLLPSVVGSAEISGRLRPDVAADLGLPGGTPVVGGGADNACAALGVGVVSPGDAAASWGTSGVVLAPTATPVVDPGLRAHTFRHAVPNTWYAIGVVLSAGAAFGWVRDQLARDLAGVPDADRRLDAEAASVPPGADGLTFLPYLQGERTPHRDPDARGALVGLTLAHTRAHVVRASLEGVCFAMRDCLAILRDLGLPFDSLLLTGGGSRSDFLRQLQADVYGLPVAVPMREEGPAFGAALLAAVSAGAFPDAAAACRATIARGEARQPDAAAHRAYAEPYARFRALYPALRALRS